MVEIFKDAANRLRDRGDTEAAIITEGLVAPILKEAGLLAETALPLNEDSADLLSREFSEAAIEAPPAPWNLVQSAAAIINANTVSIEEAGRSKNLDRTAFYYLVHKNKIPAVKVGGKLRLSRNAVEEYIPTSPRIAKRNKSATVNSTSTPQTED